MNRLKRLTQSLSRTQLKGSLGGATAWTKHNKKGGVHGGEQAGDRTAGADFFHGLFTERVSQTHWTERAVGYPARPRPNWRFRSTCGRRLPGPAYGHASANFIASPDGRRRRERRGPCYQSRMATEIHRPRFSSETNAASLGYLSAYPDAPGRKSHSEPVQ
jgi:hypothetical protein